MPTPSTVLMAGLCAFGLWFSPVGSSEAAPDEASQAPETKRLDVIYWPTPPEVVAKMLELADPKPGEVLYDLGCGDGRIVVAAAKTYGVKAVGIDIDPRRVKQSNENVKKAGVGSLVTIRRQDVFEIDLSEASVVTMYLLPNLNQRLRPQLAKLKPGARVVSHAFLIPGVKPKATVKVRSPHGEQRTVLLYVAPLEDEG